MEESKLDTRSLEAIDEIKENLDFSIQRAIQHINSIHPSTKHLEREDARVAERVLYWGYELQGFFDDNSQIDFFCTMGEFTLALRRFEVLVKSTEKSPPIHRF
jgi:hypothetical protein